MVRKLLVIALALTCLLMPAVAAAASYNPFSTACQSGTNQSSACNPNQSPIIGKNGVIKKVTDIVATIAGITAVIIIMIGGLQYVVSNGDAQKTTNARNAIIGGAVGLGIVAAAQGIILLVLSRLQ